MQEEACLSLNEQIAMKTVLLDFICRVAMDETNKSEEEVAILPQIIEITARLYRPFPVQS